MPEFVSHVVAGTIAGFSSIIVGHPFDTIKVKMQASTTQASAIQLTAQTMRAEGVRGLYRGMGMLLATVAGCNAVLFASRGYAADLLKHKDGSPPRMVDHVLASGFGGLCCALIASPAELVKCRLQAQGAYDAALTRFKAWDASGRMGVAPTLYKGPGDVLRNMMQKEGGLRSLGTGLGTAALRDTVGCAAMFAVYEGIKDVMVQHQGLTSKDQLGMAPLVVAGGLGGMAMWITVYPLDVVKSKLQTQSVKAPQFKGLWDCGRQLYVTGGMRSLYKGLGPCLARSFPANAAAFLTYEVVAKRIRGSAP